MAGTLGPPFFATLVMFLLCPASCLTAPRHIWVSAELVLTEQWGRSHPTALSHSSLRFFPSAVGREGKSGHETAGHAISPAAIQESLR